MHLDQLSPIQILNSQILNETKCEMADFIIDTSTSIDDAKKQVLNVLKILELKWEKLCLIRKLQDSAPKVAIEL